MAWSKVEGKAKPHYGVMLLCAWKATTKSGSYFYDVLTHWPDGTWTDDADDVVEHDELPDYWQAISPPVDA